MAAIALRSPIAAMALPHPARPWVFAAWPSHPARAPASGPCPDFGRPPGRRRPPLSRFPLRPMTMHPEQDDVTTQAGDAPGNDATIDTDDLVEKLKGEIEQLRARALVEHAELRKQPKPQARHGHHATHFAHH